MALTQRQRYVLAGALERLAPLPLDDAVLMSHLVIKFVVVVMAVTAVAVTEEEEECVEGCEEQFNPIRRGEGAASRGCCCFNASMVQARSTSLAAYTA